MSTQTNPQVQQALAVVMSGVHKRAFLHKLAQLGHQAESTTEEDALVQLGFKLASLDPTVREPNPFLVQSPQRPPGKYAQASAALDSMLGLEKQSEADHIYDVALALAQDPQIYGAALTIKQAAAQAQAPAAA